jgi:hypothetical protein
MSFLNLEVRKGKPTKYIKIMPHLKLSKNMFLGQTNLKKNKKLQFMKIWSNFNHSKFLAIK